MFEPRFISHSGVMLPFKIECDALTFADWDVLAELIASRVENFNEVHGIPTGGFLLAERLVDYCVPQTKKRRRILIVDDVLTTGASMEAYRMRFQRPETKVKGVVVFARSSRHLPNWVEPVFLLRGVFADDF